MNNNYVSYLCRIFDSSLSLAIEQRAPFMVTAETVLKENKNPQLNETQPNKRKKYLMKWFLEKKKAYLSKRYILSEYSYWSDFLNISMNKFKCNRD